EMCMLFPYSRESQLQRTSWKLVLHCYSKRCFLEDQGAFERYNMLLQLEWRVNTYSRPPRGAAPISTLLTGTAAHRIIPLSYIPECLCIQRNDTWMPCSRRWPIRRGAQSWLAWPRARPQ